MAGGFLLSMGQLDMNEVSSFTYLGKLQSIDSLVLDVLGFEDSDWHEFDKRRSRGGAASTNTDTIPLIWGSADRRLAQVPHKHYQKFSTYIDEVIEIASSHYGTAVVTRCFFARLRASRSIPRHKDVGVVSQKSHRVHIPVATHPLCTFTVGDKCMHIPLGEVWTIDNTGEYHSIENLSEIDRIHLIVDIG